MELIPFVLSTIKIHTHRAFLTCGRFN
jgi:hypothetical protein